MNSIAIFVCFSFYKLIAFYIFLRFFTIFVFCDRITFFIYKFSNYFWSIFFLLVDMNSIAVFICFSFYKLIAFNIFLRFFTIFTFCDRITFFVYELSNYFCWIRFLSINIDYISLLICFCSYYFISFDIFAWMFSFLSVSNFISIFINILSYNIWCKNFLLVNMNCITIIIFICAYIIVTFYVYLILCSVFWKK